MDVNILGNCNQIQLWKGQRGNEKKFHKRVREETKADAEIKTEWEKFAKQKKFYGESRRKAWTEKSMYG